MNQSIKSRIMNNILVAMMEHMSTDALHILERVIVDELVQVNIEVINTLPVEAKDSVFQKNKYIIQLFLIKKKNLKERTKHGYLKAVKRLLTAIDFKPLDKIDDNDIEWYLNLYERRNLSSSGKLNSAQSVNNEMRFLSAFFTWMRRAKMISENPVEGVEPMRIIQKPIDYFTPEEMARLRDACSNTRDRAIFEVFRSTGARVGEIADIRQEQINMQNGDIQIISEKSNQYRTLFLDADALYYYKLYHESRDDDSPYMFVSFCKPHGGMSTCAYRGVFKKLGVMAGIKTRVYPHKLRKTLGMMLINKGVSLSVVKEILGHSDTAVTSTYYAQSTPDTLRYERMKAS